jgi:hypothetical protein
MMPEEMEYEEGQPIPPGYQRETRIRKGLVIGGAVTFGTVYLITAVGGAIAVDAGADEGAFLFIPVAGPLVFLPDVDESVAASVLLVVNSIAQAGGLAMLIVGLAAQEDVLVYKGNYAEVEVTPVVSPQLTGANLTARF